MVLVQTGVAAWCFRVVQVCSVRGGGENGFGSGMLTTKYPGAVSGTNSNKSFSKGTVVNSRVSCNCLFQRKERHLQLMLYKYLSGQREKKNKRNKTIFLPTLASPNFQTISKTKKTFDLSLWCSVSKETNKKATYHIVLTADWLV